MLQVNKQRCFVSCVWACSHLEIEMASCAFYVSLLSFYCLNHAETYCLIYWPEEESTSIVTSNELYQCSSFSVDSSCTLRLGRKLYHGRIAGIGKSLMATVWCVLNVQKLIITGMLCKGTKLEMEELDARFVSGHFNPSSSPPPCDKAYSPTPPSSVEIQIPKGKCSSNCILLYTSCLKP